ncbi:MAG TPA: hypothetical protein VIC58_09910 [Actinomycetota bacterium]
MTPSIEPILRGGAVVATGGGLHACGALGPTYWPDVAGGIHVASGGAPGTPTGACARIAGGAGEAWARLIGSCEPKGR